MNGTQTTVERARELARLTLDEAESRYRAGAMSQAEWEGYTWVWATSAPRFGSYDLWRREPECADARLVGAALRAVL